MFDKAKIDSDYRKSETPVLEAARFLFQKMRVTYLTLIIPLFLLIFCTGEIAVINDPPPPVEPQPVYNCSLGNIDSVPYVDSITCPEEFSLLEGPPLMQTMGQVSSIKVVYDLSSSKLYYVSSDKFLLHFDFCISVLKYPKSHSSFNQEQYFNNNTRLYYLGTINYFSASDIYALEFFADDRITAEGIDSVYNEVKKSAYFGPDLYFMPTSTSLENRIEPIRHKIRTITQDEVFKGQTFQCLNKGEAYGYLRKIDISELSTTYLGHHDIVITNGIPNDIPAISGIITTVFQSPLSHINVLSHNRGTPNMAYKKGWSDEGISFHSEKLVHLVVTPDSFFIQSATIDEATAYWNSIEPSLPVSMECNDSTSGIFSITDVSHSSISLVGAKAANLGELTKIKIANQTIPIPDGAFAIPFYYYRQHMKSNKLDVMLDSILNDQTFISDRAVRKTTLEFFRKRIIKSPIDTNFVRQVEIKIRSLTSCTSIRFRSSTNAEDLEGFNGAGLYESYTAVLGDPGKSIGEAIKKVYASMWTLEGFEEREYFKINQHSIAMGILAHRSFSDERANGVAITSNIFNPFVAAFTINVQKGETSVVNPPQETISDQLLFYLMSETAFIQPSIEYLSHSNLNNNIPVLNENEIVSLCKLLNAIKYHFYFNVYPRNVSFYEFAMDVEFKFDGPDRKIYIKQARPY